MSEPAKYNQFVPQQSGDPGDEARYENEAATRSVADRIQDILTEVEGTQTEQQALYADLSGQAMDMGDKLTVTVYTVNVLRETLAKLTPAPEPVAAPAPEVAPKKSRRKKGA